MLKSKVFDNFVPCKNIQYFYTCSINSKNKEALMKNSNLIRQVYTKLLLFLMCLFILSSSAACHTHIDLTNEPETTTEAETEVPIIPYGDGNSNPVKK
jgi:hypothetical protein